MPSYPEASGNRYWPDVHMAHSPRPNRRPNIALGVAEVLPLALLLMAEDAPTALPLALPLALPAALVAAWKCASLYMVATVNCRAPVFTNRLSTRQRRGCGVRWLRGPTPSTSSDKSP